MNKNIIEISVAVVLAIITILLIYLITCHILDEYVCYNCLESKSIATLYMWVYRQFNIVKNYVTF